MRSPIARSSRVTSHRHADSFALLILVASASAVGGGCEDGVCPAGTMDVDGVCENKLGQEKTGGAAIGGSSDGSIGGAPESGSGGAGGQTGSSGSEAHAGAGGMSTMSGTGDTDGVAAGSGGMSSMPAGGGGAAAGGAGSTSGPPACVKSSEVCDNKDNDCDGKVDDFTEPCGPMMVGICRTGTKTCTAGVWTECAGAVTASTETCDPAKLDEDCDGVPNEGCDCSPNETAECGQAGGICRKGTLSCVNGKWSTECVGKIDPQAEVCDPAKLDEDCDGTSNEGCDCTNGQTMECGIDTGACQIGRKVCTNGKWPTGCANEITANSETCDGIDNDCDNQNDNGGDALCPSGLRCLGTKGCRQCGDDSHCAGIATAACQVSYCDLTSNTCKQRAANDGTSCGGTERCLTGTCVDCLTNDDCSSGQRCNLSSHTCEPIPYCGDRRVDPGEDCDDGNLSNQDACVACKNASCGDGYVRSTEECDPASASFTPYTCDPVSCRRRTFYTACTTHNDCVTCPNGPCMQDEGWACVGTTCRHPSSQLNDPAACDRDCPRAKPTDRVYCYGIACTLACNSNPDCPPGTRCVLGGWGNDGSGNPIAGICANPAASM